MGFGERGKDLEKLERFFTVRFIFFVLTGGEAGDRLIPFDDTIHERRP
jgi:hypothetical protein